MIVMRVCIVSVNLRGHCNRSNEQDERTVMLFNMIFDSVLILELWNSDNLAH